MAVDVEAVTTPQLQQRVPRTLTVGRQLRWRRRRLDLSQLALGSLVGASQALITRAEADLEWCTPGIRQLQLRLSEQLEVLEREANATDGAA